jgi:4-hydroxybenzoate polyprenyltransferase
MPLAGTTVADVWAGFFCAGGMIETAPEAARLLVLHAAAIALYLAGMTLNDAFDAGDDATKHPERPIPSGILTRRDAFVQGFALLAIGVGCAFLAGLRPGLGACALAAMILAYDGFLKRWAVPGAIAMGCCRALDVHLGSLLVRQEYADAFGSDSRGLYSDHFDWIPALALGIYIFGVTMISTQEDRPGLDKKKVGRLVFTLLRGIFIVDALMLAVTRRFVPALLALALVFTVPLLARAQARLTSPSPPR